MSAPAGFSWTDALDQCNKAQRDVFGQVVTYTPSGRAPLLLKAIDGWPREWGPVEPGVLAVRSIRLADLAQPPANGDTVQLGDAMYEVIDVRTKGGIAWLSLGKVR